jgi:hypothetical protein
MLSWITAFPIGFVVVSDLVDRILRSLATGPRVPLVQPQRQQPDAERFSAFKEICRLSARNVTRAKRGVENLRHRCPRRISCTNDGTASPAILRCGCSVEGLSAGLAPVARRAGSHVWSLVAAERGISILPACALNLRSDGVEFLRLQLDHVRMEIVLAWPKMSTSTVLRSFLDPVEAKQERDST